MRIRATGGDTTQHSLPAPGWPAQDAITIADTPARASASTAPASANDRRPSRRRPTAPAVASTRTPRSRSPAGRQLSTIRTCGSRGAGHISIRPNRGWLPVASTSSRWPVRARAWPTNGRRGARRRRTAHHTPPTRDRARGRQARHPAASWGVPTVAVTATVERAEQHADGEQHRVSVRGRSPSAPPRRPRGAPRPRRGLGGERDGGSGTTGRQAPRRATTRRPAPELNSRPATPPHLGHRRLDREARSRRIGDQRSARACTIRPAASPSDRRREGEDAAQARGSTASRSRPRWSSRHAVVCPRRGARASGPRHQAPRQAPSHREGGRRRAPGTPMPSVASGRHARVENRRRAGRWPAKEVMHDGE